MLPTPKYPLPVGAPVLISCLYDRERQRDQKAYAKPYGEIAPYFTIAEGSEYEQGWFDSQMPVMPSNGATSQYHGERPESRFIPAEYIIPIKLHEQGLNAPAPCLFMEIERFEFARRFEAGGWCNLRLYKLPSVPATYRMSPLSSKTPDQINPPMRPNWLLLMGEVIGQFGYANEGRSVINAVELIAERFARLFRSALTGGMNPLGNVAPLRFVNFLPRRVIGKIVHEESFDWVQMRAIATRGIDGSVRYGDASFHPAERAEIETLVGQAIDPLPIPSLTAGIEAS